MRFIKNIINFILPPRCYLCGKVLENDKGLCDECISKIKFLNETICYKCGAPLFDCGESNAQKMLCGNCLKNKNKMLFQIIVPLFYMIIFLKNLY